MLQALYHCNINRIIHRDLKPANIMISPIFLAGSRRDFLVKIADFGLAQQESDGADMSQSSNRIGTAYYMSPEQHRGEELDSRTDIYSLGILTYELFTGKRPFDGSTTFKLFLAHVSEGIPEEALAIQEKLVASALPQFSTLYQEKTGNPKEHFIKAFYTYLAGSYLREFALSTKRNPKEWEKYALYALLQSSQVIAQH